MHRQTVQLEPFACQQMWHHHGLATLDMLAGQGAVQLHQKMPVALGWIVVHVVACQSGSLMLVLLLEPEQKFVVAEAGLQAETKLPQAQLRKWELLVRPG